MLSLLSSFDIFQGYGGGVIILVLVVYVPVTFGENCWFGATVMANGGGRILHVGVCVRGLVPLISQFRTFTIDVVTITVSFILAGENIRPYLGVL